MAKFNSQSAYNLVQEILQAFGRMARYGARLLQRMSPQALLGAALIMAFILTILPLALLLFVILLLLKIVLGVSVVDSRRQRRRSAPQQ